MIKTLQSEQDKPHKKRKFRKLVTQANDYQNHEGLSRKSIERLKTSSQNKRKFRTMSKADQKRVSETKEPQFYTIQKEANNNIEKYQKLMSLFKQFLQKTNKVMKEPKLELFQRHVFDCKISSTKLLFLYIKKKCKQQIQLSFTQIVKFEKHKVKQPLKKEKTNSKAINSYPRPQNCRTNIFNVNKFFDISLQ